MKRMYRSLLLAVFISEALVSAALAQAQPEAQEEDGPGRGVARISLLNGDVTVRRGDSGDWVAAAVNAPLLADDRVLSGVNAHAEVQLDYYNRIRLAGDTEIRFSELDWHKYQVQVAHGTVIFSALPGTNDQIEFATPAAALRPLAPGSYRMTVIEDGSVEFTVRRGEAEIYTPHGSRRLTPGRTMRLHLSPDNIPEFQYSGEAPRDGFDEFSDRRDHDLQNSQAYQHVSRDIEGAEDLDGQGEWVNQEPYGPVWRPYVAPDWAPYREGRWEWVDDSYGWTWISYDPWGWAPYHYGRWFCEGGAWFWYPGALRGRHYWRPGLVAFFGYGGFGVGVGFGGFGWVPLAPFETYHPWYGHHGYGGYRNHVIHGADITGMYRNARVRNAVSGVNARDFVHGTAGGVRAINASQLGRTSVMQGALPVSPSRDSLRMSDQPVSGALAARAAQSGNERFVASRTAPASNRVPFGSLNAGGQRATGNGGGFIRAGGAQAASGRGSELGAAAGGTRSATQGGWTRMGNGAGAGNSRGSVNAGSGSAQSSSGAARGGWGSFGTPSGRTTAGASAQGTATNPTTSQRGGWTSFGSPDRGGSGGGQTNRGAWSTGGGTSGGNYDRSERGSASRPEGWSSGGSSSPRYSAPSGGSSSHQSAPAPARSSGGGGGSGSHSGGGGGGHSSRR
ncbi:MAG: hypothetical protein P4K98_10640 [Bryobacteraceae bacterium]|nr:hypothetical protein [Bryobacteraceae bacterium]